MIQEFYIMRNSETRVDIRSRSMTENTYILRKEKDEWLSFQDQNHTITQLGNIALEDIILDGRIVRIVNRDEIDGALSAPLKLFVSVSNECNLSCNHCMSDSSPHGKRLMSPDDLKQISDEAADMGVFQITIGGGEPLLYKGLWDVVSHMRQNYLGVSMTTNAYVVRESDIDNLKEYNVTADWPVSARVCSVLIAELSGDVLLGGELPLIARMSFGDSASSL